MASRDLKNNISVVNTLVPATRNAAATGGTVDLLAYEGVAIEAIVGTIADGTHSLAIEHSDDGTTWVTAPANDLQGSFANLASNTNQEVGYIGFKRYLRVNATSSGVTGGAYAVAVVRGFPGSSPV
jgi:hypothetical protein